MNNPLVSIIMITYGHEEYIEESINRILEQNFNESIEFIISNDCSPDNTDDIIREILRVHPKGYLIKYIKHNENKGAIPNFVWTLSQAKGKYIALCEGDDYWTDPLKLQKQVDFLENNPDYSIVFHKVREVNISGQSTDTIIDSPEQEETYDLKYLATGNFIHTPSVVFKKSLNEIPEWLKSAPIGDYPLHMLNAQFGLIKYLPEEMAVYRIGNGIWSSQSRIYQIINTMFTVKLLISHFSGEKEIRQILTGQYNLLMTSLLIYHNHTTPVSPETIAYNLPFKRLLLIIIRKLKHMIK